jgi:4'-phosphopantetheinyl transferase
MTMPLRVGRIAPQVPASPTAAVISCIADGEIEVVATALDVAGQALAGLAALLSEAERQRAARFVFERDRRRFIVARARLRQLLGARLAMQPESLEFAYGAHGKPMLARRRGEPDLRFNLSHAEDLAVYAFAADREVGIDVEAVRVMQDADDVAASAFSSHENEAYRRLDPSDRPQGFFNCWTRKEAFIKALGEGLSHPLDSFDVSLKPGEPAKILRVGELSGDDCGWALQTFVPQPGFAAAIVVKDGRS